MIRSSSMDDMDDPYLDDMDDLDDLHDLDDLQSGPKCSSFFFCKLQHPRTCIYCIIVLFSFWSFPLPGWVAPYKQHDTGA